MVYPAANPAESACLGKTYTYRTAISNPPCASRTAEHNLDSREATGLTVFLPSFSPLVIAAVWERTTLRPVIVEAISSGQRLPSGICMYRFRLRHVRYCLSVSNAASLPDPIRQRETGRLSAFAPARHVHIRHADIQSRHLVQTLAALSVHCKLVYMKNVCTLASARTDASRFVPWPHNAQMPLTVRI